MNYTEEEAFKVMDNICKIFSSYYNISDIRKFMQKGKKYYILEKDLLIYLLRYYHISETMISKYWFGENKRFQTNYYVNKIQGEISINLKTKKQVEELQTLIESKMEIKRYPNVIEEILDKHVENPELRNVYRRKFKVEQIEKYRQD